VRRDAACADERKADEQRRRGKAVKDCVESRQRTRRKCWLPQPDGYRMSQNRNREAAALIARIAAIAGRVLDLGSMRERVSSWQFIVYDGAEHQRG